MKQLFKNFTLISNFKTQFVACAIRFKKWFEIDAWDFKIEL